MRRFPKTIPKQLCALDTSFGHLKYLLARSSRRRTLAVYVDDKANVIVYSPNIISQDQINLFINEHAKWLQGKINAANEKQKILQQKSFKAGQKYYYLGNIYELEVIKSNENKISLIFKGNKWLAKIPNDISQVECEQKLKKEFIRWYRKEAREVVASRIFNYSRALSVLPNKITIKTQKRMWGNCDYGKKSINFNWQIVMAPLKVIDYVIVHELCHLIVPSHSKRFWQKVKKVIPDFQESKQWLKNNYYEMIIL